MKEEFAWTMAKEITEHMVHGTCKINDLQKDRGVLVADFVTALAERLQENYWFSKSQSEDGQGPSQKQS